MLTAVRESDGAKVLALFSERNAAPFRCPECAGEVTLRKGRVRVHHFAHKPPVLCWNGAGETEAHRQCKIALWQTLQSSPRLEQVELERQIGSVRPDLSFQVQGQWVGVEIQRSNMTRERILKRTLKYVENGLAILWLLPGLPPEENEKIRPRDWQRWLHGLSYGRVYYWSGHRATITPVHYGPAYSYVELRSWYGEGGEEMSAGGYDRLLKDTKTALPGRSLELAEFTVKPRNAWSSGKTEYPACKVLMDPHSSWWPK